MMIMLTYISIALLSMGLLTALFNILSGPRLAKPPGPLLAQPRVSLLVPARNEENNIDDLLEGLSGQNYPNLEILVLDDHSSDATAEKVLGKMAGDSRIRLLQGQPMPQGWTGKNWACRQLADQATGEYLIFTDADNRHAPQAVSHTLAWMQRYGLGMLSAFPRQITKSLSESLVIPVVDLFVYATLPLWLTFRLKSPLFAAANGQWIAFTRQAYRTIGGHTSVKGEVVEDVALSRRIKQHRIPMLLTAGTGAISCRMYHNAGEVWGGFSKNLYGIAGYRLAPFLAILAGHFIAYIWPFIAIFFPELREPAAIAIAMNLFLRLSVALRYRHPVGIAVGLHPLGVALLLAIGINSIRLVKKGFVRWKGREIPV